MERWFLKFMVVWLDECAGWNGKGLWRAKRLWYVGFMVLSKVLG